MKDVVGVVWWVVKADGWRVVTKHFRGLVWEKGFIIRGKKYCTWEKKMQTLAKVLSRKNIYIYEYIVYLEEIERRVVSFPYITVVKHKCNKLSKYFFKCFKRPSGSYRKLITQLN